MKLGGPGNTQCYGPESGILKPRQLSKKTNSSQPENLLPWPQRLLCLCLGSLSTLSFSPVPPPSQLPLLSCQVAGCLAVFVVQTTACSDVAAIAAIPLSLLPLSLSILLESSKKQNQTNKKQEKPFIGLISTHQVVKNKRPHLSILNDPEQQVNVAREGLLRPLGTPLMQMKHCVCTNHSSPFSSLPLVLLWFTYKKVSHHLSSLGLAVAKHWVELFKKSPG